MTIFSDVRLLNETEKFLIRDLQLRATSPEKKKKNTSVRFQPTNPGSRASIYLDTTEATKRDW